MDDDVRMVEANGSRHMGEYLADGKWLSIPTVS